MSTAIYIQTFTELEKEYVLFINLQTSIADYLNMPVTK